MTTKPTRTALILTALLFTALAPARAQRVAGAAVLGSLKVGQWVKMQGVPQPDFSINTGKIKFVTGDFQDNDWEIFGPVRAIDRQKKEFMILNLKIKVAEATEFKGENAGRSSNGAGSDFKSFEQLQAGMLVEVEGSFLKDGTFLADNVKDNTATTDPEDANEIECFGKIEKIDAAKRIVTMMGVTFKITEATKLKSAVK